MQPEHVRNKTLETAFYQEVIQNWISKVVRAVNTHAKKEQLDEIGRELGKKRQ